MKKIYVGSQEWEELKREWFESGMDSTFSEYRNEKGFYIEKDKE